MKSSFFFSLVLLGAAHIQAMPITSGQVVFDGDSAVGSFLLNGPNFSISGGLFLLDHPTCYPACGLGEYLGTRVFFSPGLVPGFQGTVNGVFYPNLNIGNAFLGPASSFTIFGSPILLTEQLVYTTTFTIQGDLILLRGSSFECVLCGPLDPSGVPTAIPVSGSGQVTIGLQRYDQPNHPPGFILDRVVYQVQIPEPSTFMMLSMSLAFYALTRRFSQRRKLSRF